MTDAIDGFRPETVVAIGAVEQGLSLARSGIGADDITSKGARDLVTATDVAVEDRVRATVGDALGFPVVGEERGGDAPIDGAPHWFLDPTCRTRNFASRIPLYCVNLALVEDGQVTVAVVGDASTGEINVAERDRGAWVLKESERGRLTTSEESQTIIIEVGNSEGVGREHAAQFTGDAIRSDRWDLRPGRSVPTQSLPAQIRAFTRSCSPS